MIPMVAPTKVTRSELQNASTVAAMFLTTEAVIKLQRKHRHLRMEEDEVDTIKISQKHTKKISTKFSPKIG
ncbi:hypothetical protein J6TS2_48400 [Heyndrickxia sporothermodurans]|nr:hypothetical protein J6TS2_48400 [Heyndrickxia sporothermodurans]